MNLKNILKTIKLHEQEINIILGVLILILAGIFVIKYVKNLKNQSTQSQTPTTQNQNQTYKVVKGDNLWKIAEKFYKDGSQWKKIADANKISSPSKIEVGQVLTIPLASTEPQATAETKPSATPTPQIIKEAASTSSEIKENSYTVVKGDNLWKIALRAYGDGNMWHKIAEANKLKNPRIIHAGNVFSVPR